MQNLEAILLEEHNDFKAQADKFIAGELTNAEFKPFAAKLGIYEQSNGQFMARIRIEGGVITTAKLRIIAETITSYNATFAHLTTRQTIQIHGLAPQELYPLIRHCSKNGLPFRGGGGDTYRNIAMDPYSGLSEESAFDVYPYVQALNNFEMLYDKAFNLPRKLKIAFSSNSKDTAGAIMQDLGFVAKIKDGKKCFQVFIGGGAGRETQTGIKVFDHLPASDILKCTVALTELFYDHGDRTNRHSARLRFVLKKLGEKPFKKLFLDYYQKTNAPALSIDSNYTAHTPRITSPPDAEEYTICDQEGFDEWRKIAVTKSSLNDTNTTVRIYVPHGRLGSKILKEITLIAEQAGCGELRLTKQQNLILPAVHTSLLPVIWEALKKADVDLCAQSMKGLLTSCIGSNVCKIGILDAPSLADDIAETFDHYFEHNPDKKVILFNRAIDHIRISGCPNSCAMHLTAKIGLQGIKKRIDGASTYCCKIFTGGEFSMGKLATPSLPESLPINEIPKFILEKFLSEYAFN